MTHVDCTWVMNQKKMYTYCKMVNFRTSKQKRRNAELVHGLISGESNRNRRSHIGRRPNGKTAPFTREQAEQAIVNTLQKKLRFNADQARATMEYAKKFKNPRVLTHFLAHVAYRAVGDLNVIPIYGNYRRSLNQKNLGTYTRYWKIFMHRIHSTWANTNVSHPLQASVDRFFVGRHLILTQLSIIGLLFAVGMHMYLDVLYKYMAGRWEWDRVRQEVGKITEQLAYWGGRLHELRTWLRKKADKAPKSAGNMGRYAGRKFGMAFLKETISSFSDDLSKINSANGVGKQFGKFMRRTVVRALEDIAANTKKKSSVTLTNITNNGDRKKINVATRSNANNNNGGRKKNNVATRSNANNNSGGRKRNNVATRSNANNNNGGRKRNNAATRSNVTNR